MSTETLDLSKFKPAGSDKTFAEIQAERNEQPQGTPQETPQETPQATDEAPQETPETSNETPETVASSEAETPETTQETPQATEETPQATPNETPAPVNAQAETLGQAQEPNPTPEEPSSVAALESLKPEIRQAVELIESDPYLADAIKYYEKNKTLAPYAEAMKHDYQKMDALDVLRLKHEKDYPNLSPKNRQRLFERDVLSKYQLDEDEFDAEDVELSKELLEQDASKVRESLIEEQRSFIPADLPPQKTQEEINAEIQVRQDQERQVVSSALKDVLESKTVEIKVGDTPFNYQITNTENLVEFAVNPTKMIQSFITNEGVDWNKWARAVAYIENPEAYDAELVKHGKGLAKKEVHDELENPSIPESTAPDDVSENGNRHPYEDPSRFARKMKIVG